MTRFASILLYLLVLTSCTSNNGSIELQTKDTLKSKTITHVKDSRSDTSIRLDFFTSVPDTIDGCGEYFTYDTSKFANNNYIFLSNLQSFAIIKINGENLYLNRDATESKEINDKSYIAVYKGNGYKAILKINQTIAYDEGGFYTGTLHIIGEKFQAEFKVHGESGC